MRGCCLRVSASRDEGHRGGVKAEVARDERDAVGRGELGRGAVG